MRRIRRFAAPLALGILPLLIGSTAGPAAAQLSVPSLSTSLPGSGDSGMVGEMGTVGKALVEYCHKNGHLPSNTAEIDDALQFIAKRLTFASVGASLQPAPASDGQYRVLGNVEMALDPGMRNANPDQLRASPPQSWRATKNRIVVLIAGADQFIAWYSAWDEKPAVDSLGRAVILHQQCSK